MLYNKGKEQSSFIRSTTILHQASDDFLSHWYVYRPNCSISLLIHFSILFVHSLVYLFWYAPQTLFMILPFGHLILDSVEKCFK